MPHNHPPRCCCFDPINRGQTAEATCPSCVEHGELANPECDSCHAQWGRPHTEYCKAVAPAEYPGQPDRCTYPPAECDQPSCQMRGQCATETEVPAP